MDYDNLLDENLTDIAEVCDQFESLNSVQSYGISFLNSYDDENNKRCDNCINWEGGSCVIFRLTNEL
jgi:hypothetical protein